MVHEDSLERLRALSPSTASVANVRVGKALIVDGDEKTRAAACNLLLTSARQPFDCASSFTEAVELLKRSNYVCIFAGSEIPAFAGETPRRQDLENLLDEIDRLKGSFKPPVVCLYTRAMDVDDDTWTCWVTDMSLRGVIKWVKKPFPSSGRTPDRVLKKVLNGQYVRVVKATPLTPAELMAAPLGDESELEAAPPRSRPREQVLIGPLLSAENYLPEMDTDAIVAKLGKMLGKAGASNDTTESPNVPKSKVPEPDTSKSDTLPLTARPKHDPITVTTASTATATPAVAAAPDNDRWKNIPNDPITLDGFMAEFCEPRSKELRVCRKNALLAATRNGTVKLPPLAGIHKPGMPYRFLVHDLLVAWPGFLNEKVDLPPLATSS